MAFFQQMPVAPAVISPKSRYDFCKSGDEQLTWARAFIILIVLVFIVGVFDIPIWGTKKWGFIDTQGNIVIKPIFDRINGIGEGSLAFTVQSQKSFHEGLAAVAVGKLWGFIDKSGKIIIKPQFQSVGDFSNGLACVQLNDQCGFVDYSGKLVIPAKFNPHALYCGFTVFREGLCSVEEKELWSMGYIDKAGNYIVKPQGMTCRPFSEGLAAVSSQNGFLKEFIDRTGKVVFKVDPGKYSGVIYAENFSEGRALVDMQMNAASPTNPERRCWFIDNKGKRVTKEFQKGQRLFRRLSGSDANWLRSIRLYRSPGADGHSTHF